MKPKREPYVGQEPKKPRGFATLSPERMREIASKGGRALKPEQRSFSQDPALAARAGRKGGQHPKRRPVV